MITPKRKDAEIQKKEDHAKDKLVSLVKNAQNRREGQLQSENTMN
jgi:hypothetical protein